MTRLVGYRRFGSVLISPCMRLGEHGESRLAGITSARIGPYQSRDTVMGMRRSRRPGDATAADVVNKVSANYT